MTASLHLGCVIPEILGNDYSIITRLYRAILTALQLIHSGVAKYKGVRLPFLEPVRRDGGQRVAAGDRLTRV